MYQPEYIDFANSLDEAFKEREERGPYKFTGRVLSEKEKEVKSVSSNVQLRPVLKSLKDNSYFTKSYEILQKK